jgi:hypothetical protein
VTVLETGAAPRRTCGPFTLGTDAIVRDPGVSDQVDLNALQHQVQHLPAETLLFLLGSRYCETDRLSDEAWRLISGILCGAMYLMPFLPDFLPDRPVDR